MCRCFFNFAVLSVVLSAAAAGLPLWAALLLFVFGLGLVSTVFD